MCIDFRSAELQEKFHGEDVIVRLNEYGDLVIIPCTRRINKLASVWHEHGLNSRDMCAVIREDWSPDRIDIALNDLGVPDVAHEWLHRGHSIVFTCIALETLDTYLFTSNGIGY
jgi:hypothetical protein